MELLSPAGGAAAFEAAIANGADAVYLGLKQLNARAGAANFTPEELKECCRKAHENRAKVYLTLNIDLTQRELGLAARSLAVAADAQVDGILFRDPAFLLLKPYFPTLAFHFSTQAGISTSAGVRAGNALGLTRVVLARELSLEEIRQAAKEDCEVEVFGQGALCFSCSGRCLLSSWGGGRSGNRGACTSPCRILWTPLSNTDQEAEATGETDRFLSMHDLCSIDWIQQMQDCGVASLKIEGRLKSAAWVAKAVTLYRHAIDHRDPPELLRQSAEALGDYTGRQLTDNYLRGVHTQLTGDSRRRSSIQEPVCSCPLLPEESSSPEQIAVTLTEDEKGALLWHFQAPGKETSSQRIPPQRISNPKRATSVAQLLGEMKKCKNEVIFPDVALWENKLLPRSVANNMLDSYQKWLRSLDKGEDGRARGISLSPALLELLERRLVSYSVNPLHLGDSPDSLRLNLDQVAILASLSLPLNIHRLYLHINLTSDEELNQALITLVQTARQYPSLQLVAALPQVVYEAQLPLYQKLMQSLFIRMPVLYWEINSWDLWQLAKENLPSEKQMILVTGPGIPILNSLAGKALKNLGFTEGAVSLELDQEKLETLCEEADFPLTLTIYGRIPLMLTRVELPSGAAPLRETRKTTLLPRREGAITVLRPQQPMDWRNLHNKKIHSAHLLLDLRGFTPKELQCFFSGSKENSTPFLFNYDRRLR